MDQGTNGLFDQVDCLPQDGKQVFQMVKEDQANGVIQRVVLYDKFLFIFSP